MEQIGERTKDYIQANAGVELTRKLGTDAKMTPQELALIVKQLPVGGDFVVANLPPPPPPSSSLFTYPHQPHPRVQEYREMTGKLWQHYSITTEAMARFQHLGVLDMSELEQTMATGVDADGKGAKEEKMLASLEGMLQGLESSGMTLANKMRLLAIFIISQDGVTEEVRRQLVAAAGLSNEDQEALIHLEALGVSVQKAKGSGGGGKGYVWVRGSGSRNGGFMASMGWWTHISSPNQTHPMPPHLTRRLWGGKSKKPKRKVDAASEYAASRYVCALKELMDQAVQGELSAEAYPSVLPMPTRCVCVFVGSSWGVFVCFAEFD